MLSSYDKPPSLRPVRWAEGSRPLQGGRGPGRAAPPPGPVGRGLQLGRDLLVRAKGGGGQMPDPPIGLLRSSQHLEQRSVGGLSGGEGGVLVDGRTDQRMAKPQMGTA